MCTLKKIVLLVILLFYSHSLFSQQWVSCNIGITNNNATYISSYNENLCIGVEKSLHNMDVYVSSNNGDYWNYSTTFIGYRQEVLSVTINQNNILFCTPSGFYFSTDFGSNWNLINDSLMQAGCTGPSSLLSYENNVIFTENGAIYLSDDYGLNWVLCALGTDYTGIVCSAIDGANIITGSINSIITLSTDYGQTWKIISSLSSPIYSIGIYNNIVLAGTESGLYTSSDFGSTWTSQDEFSNKYVGSIVMNEKNIFISTSIGVYYSSKNGELNWRPLKDGLDDVAIHNLTVNSNTLFGTSFGNGVYKLDLTLLGVDSPNPENIISIYPNPAKDVITINLPYNDLNLNTVKIVNQLGNIVYEKLIIDNSNELDIKELAAGVYNCIINTKDGIFSNSFVIIR